MSVTCPDCGAVAGYGHEIGHKSDCPSLVKMTRGRDPLRNNPIVGWMSEKQAESILEEIRDQKRRGTW